MFKRRCKGPCTQVIDCILVMGNQRSVNPNTPDRVANHCSLINQPRLRQLSTRSTKTSTVAPTPTRQSKISVGTTKVMSSQWLIHHLWLRCHVVSELGTPKSATKRWRCCSVKMGIKKRSWRCAIPPACEIGRAHV